MTEEIKTTIQKVIAGDQEAFRSIILANQKLVFHVVHKMVSNRADVEDICQDVFVKVYQNLASFKQDSKLSTWIARIAYNTTLNHLEKKKVPLFDDHSPDQITLDHLPGGNGTPDQDTVESDLSARLHQVIDQLPLQFRTIVTLYHLEEMSYKEIGSILDLPEGTVKSYLFRARKRLKDQLMSEYEVEEMIQ